MTTVEQRLKEAGSLYLQGLLKPSEVVQLFEDAAFEIRRLKKAGEGVWKDYSPEFLSRLNRGEDI